MSKAEDAPLFSRVQSSTSPDRGAVKIERNSWVNVGGGQVDDDGVIEQRSNKVYVYRDADIDAQYNVILDKNGERL